MSNSYEFTTKFKADISNLKQGITQANKELKKALYNSDILNTIMYIDFLHNGVYEMVDPNEKCDDYPFIWMMDEVYLLLNFYGELFKF